jgi:uncharacterized membrane protein
VGLLGYHEEDPAATLRSVTPIESLITLALSAAPVAELRGGLPYALSRGADPEVAYGLAVLGNLLVVPILLLGLRWLERLLRGRRAADRLLGVLFARTRRKGRWIERFGAVGLVLLVAIPLPGTGAWTGAIAAVLLGIPARRALLLIALGVLVAGVLGAGGFARYVRWGRTT